MRLPLRRRPKQEGASPDEPTVELDPRAHDRLERRLFDRRRRRTRWQRWRPWVLGLVGVAVLAGLSWLVLASPYLRAERVAVTGASFLEPDQVRAAAAVPEQPLARLDTRAIVARVERLKPVASAQVRRSWPHTVQVIVTERRPVAVLPRDGSFLAMDREGVTFRPLEKRPRGLPEISEKAGADQEARVEAARVLRSLDPRLLTRVDHLEVTSIDGITLVMRDRGDRPGPRVVWGSADHSGAKADVLAALISGQLRQQVRVIDVSVPGRPTTRA